MTPDDFDYLRGFLKERSGLALSAEKQYLIDTRLSPVIRARGLDNMSALVRAVRSDPRSELATLVLETMTTNESLFFRDKVPFENFRNPIVPALREARATEKKVRIWCAACSAGQEPYSLAIAIREYQLFPADWNIEIVATDLCTAVLDRARRGLYSQFEVQRGLPIQLLVKYFTKTGESWQVNSDIRSMVSYSRFNLLEPYARLGRFDVIFCRNVLIYFDMATKTNVLERLARQIAPDGYLSLGAAETVIGLTHAFVPLPEHRGLYVPARGTHCSPPQGGPARVASPPLAPKVASGTSATRAATPAKSPSSV
jgi:chemotaxis protein methyltransferase CheR